MSFFLIRWADLDEAEGLGRRTEDKKAIHLTRFFAYALTSIAALVFYVAWVAATVPGPGSWPTRIFAAFFLCLFGGFSVAILSMALPWVLAVWIYNSRRLAGPAYFALVGALLMLIAGCVASSLSPKPLFIEDQTFFQGALIALERQGVCLTLAGTMVGLVYWLLGEKQLTRKDRTEDKSRRNG